ncbi:MAG: asparagine synthase (glutamine-hydrolyzing), partial [Coxiellaceae bacterium]|nr:asparagine synthase (glutamine-hydrolyzing) [Coxiellaceae bacterium]
CSASAHQPMHSKNQRHVMAFNGEIYNFKEIRQQLERQSEVFLSHSDTEVLLSAFNCWGIEKTLKTINGMFAIALFDRQENALYLIRDRIGQKPLYYAKQGDCFFFASELKALCQHPKFQRNINRDAVASYARLNYIPAPFSIYQKTFKLIPGSFLRFSLNNPILSSPNIYWDQEKIAESSQSQLSLLSYEAAEEQLEILLKDAVKKRMVSDVPLGAFLSGGIDSSLIVSLMQTQSSSPVRTFTIGFNEAKFNEANEARAVAKHLSTEHTEFYVSSEDARSIIPNLSTIYDEPFSDVSQIPTYLVSKLAREHVTVALSGDGGDEFFAGYNRHFWVPMLWKYFGFLPGLIKNPALHTLSLLSKMVSSSKFKKLIPMLMHRSPEAMYLDLISSWKEPNDLVVRGDDKTEYQYQQFFKQSSLDLVHKMMSLDARHYLPDDILVKVDRASMAVSLEARSPFLDYRIAEFAWKLPLQYKVKGQSGKLMLKSLLKKYIPEDLVDRPKMGFGVPIGQWLRGPLREWAGDLINSSLIQQQGYFDVTMIEKKWKEHQSG